MTPQISADDNIKKDIKNVDVQLLTQADFDCMSLARQQFIRDRIAAGQIKIVSSEDITPPPQPPQQPTLSGNPKKLQKSNKTQDKPDSSKDQKQTPPKVHPITRYVYTNPVQRLLNKPVKVTLNNGQARTGILTELWQFEMILKGATTDTELILMKHTVASIEEDTTTGQTRIVDDNTP